jgi:hypothetical protein
MFALFRRMPFQDCGSRPTLLALCVIAAGLFGSGCSFIFVDGPPAAHQKMPYFDCTTSNIAPVVDVVFAASAAVQGAAFLANQSSGSGSSSLAAEGGVVLAEAALFGVSALTGFGKTSSCREAKAQLVQRSLQNPGFYGAPGYGAPGFGAPAFGVPGGPPPQPYDPWSAPPRAGTPPDAPPPGAPGAPPAAAPIAPPAGPGAPPAAGPVAPPVAPLKTLPPAVDGQVPNR